MQQWLGVVIGSVGVAGVLTAAVFDCFLAAIPFVGTYFSGLYLLTKPPSAPSIIRRPDGKYYEV